MESLIWDTSSSPENENISSNQDTRHHAAWKLQCALEIRTDLNGPNSMKECRLQSCVSSNATCTGARSTQEEVIQCTVPPKQVCHGLSGRRVDYTIHVS